MAEKGEIYQMNLPGYWMDIGQPKDYLSGQGMYLKA
jgi:mannose-1-phosphate guanylyltransferase